MASKQSSQAADNTSRKRSFNFRISSSGSALEPVLVEEFPVVGPVPPITHCKPGRNRPTLRYDYKKPVPPSRAIRDAVSFSQIYNHHKSTNRAPDDDFEVTRIGNRRDVEFKRNELEVIERVGAKESSSFASDFTERVFDDALGVGGFSATASGCAAYAPVPQRRYKQSLLENAKEALSRLESTRQELPDLTDEERACVLWERQGCNQREIAVHAGLSAATVNRRLKSAREKMRETGEVAA